MGDWTFKFNLADSCYTVELNKIKTDIDFTEIKDEKLRSIFTKTLDTNGDQKLSEAEIHTTQKELSGYADKNTLISDTKLIEYLKSKQLKEENLPAFKKILQLITKPIKETTNDTITKASTLNETPDTIVEKQDSIQSQEIKRHSRTKEWNNYTVQLGEKIDDIVRRGLKSKGITNPTQKELENAKQSFIKMNADSVKYNQNKEAYLYAGEKVLVNGKLKDLNNKRAVIKKYLEQQKTKTGTVKYKAENCRPTYSKDILYDEVNKTHFKKINGKWVELLGASGEKITFVAKDGSYRGRRNFKGGKWIKSYYGKDGKLEKELYIDNHNKITGYNLFSYNTTSNKPTKMIYYTSQGKKQVETKYFFNGKPLQETVYNNNGSIAKDTTYTRDGNSVVIINNQNGTFKRKEEFDKHNRLCHVEDNSGISNFKYLNNGKYISEYISKETTDTPQRYLCDSNGKRLYACDSNGRKLENGTCVA